MKGIVQCLPKARIEMANIQGWRCWWCSVKMTNDHCDDDTHCTAEHLHTRGHGPRGRKNIVAACRKCNNLRGSYTGKEKKRFDQYLASMKE